MSVSHWPFACWVPCYSGWLNSSYPGFSLHIFSHYFVGIRMRLDSLSIQHQFFFIKKYLLFWMLLLLFNLLVKTIVDDLIRPDNCRTDWNNASLHVHTMFILTEQVYFVPHLLYSNKQSRDSNLHLSSFTSPSPRGLSVLLWADFPTVLHQNNYCQHCCVAVTKYSVSWLVFFIINQINMVVVDP